MKQKILIVIGTRPEAIKMAPLIKLLEHHSNYFDTQVCITAQHRQMLDQVLNTFDIKPSFDLDIMKHNQDLFSITSTMLAGIKSVLERFKPDLVLVHGDTTTTFCASLSAYYQQTPVGHVEAGLRTGNIYSPFPEEINRRLTGAIARYHFAPTDLAKHNLSREGITDGVYVTGNTVVDALFLSLDMISNDIKLQEEVSAHIKKSGYDLARERKILLITGHRRENFGEGFRHICEAIITIAKKYPELDLVYPVHLNPNVKKPVFQMLDGYNNVFLTKPMDYLPFLYLMNRSLIVLTDSGGIQEEAPSLGKPVIVMRNTTERPEAVDAGTVILAGTDKQKIIDEVRKLLDNPDHYHRMSVAHNPYGDGKAAERILNILKSL
jgi:UDP-N-acetylglucosamine 2-epimerase (non-hydrolysing)